MRTRAVMTVIIVACLITVFLYFYGISGDPVTSFYAAMVMVFILAAVMTYMNYSMYR